MFRLRVSQLALTDPKVWDAIMLLASTSLLLTVRSDQGRFQKLEELQRDALPLSASASATERLASVLARVGNQMVADPFSQQRPPENFRDFNVGKELVVGENIELDLSVAWLVLRLSKMLSP
ncbi:hypothetical protein LIA77_11804 [Sarocladium implicatum]|nr:hypothetical protein LIA77_11804 [Sarocladium implicatum]